MRAVIDVGSNSVLLAVAQQQGQRWVAVHETSEVTALGEGVKQTSQLSEPAMLRTLAAVGRAHQVCHTMGVTEVRSFATMAARIAANAGEFLRQATAMGTPIEVLSGDDEAEYGFLAVANDPLFGDTEKLSIIDPGGHSTELITAHRDSGSWKKTFKKSFPVGTLALTGDLLAAESPTSLDLLKASTAIDDLLQLDYAAGEAGIAVVLGATGTNLVTLRDRLDQWNPDLVHGSTLDYEEVSRAVGWLAPMSLAERGALVGMERGREATIHAGALILERFLYGTRSESCRVSVRGWRHAIIETDSFWPREP